MTARVEVRVVVKPGRLEDAIADVEMVNKITERISGVRGHMFVTSFGGQSFGRTALTWDFPSEEVAGRFNDVAATDPEFADLMARVLGPDSAWVVPATRELLTQIV